MASLRQLERREGITPDNNFDILLDKYYPDEFMDSIFTNKKNIM